MDKPEITNEYLLECIMNQAEMLRRLAMNVGGALPHVEPHIRSDYDEFIRVQKEINKEFGFPE